MTKGDLKRAIARLEHVPDDVPIRLYERGNVYDLQSTRVDYDNLREVIVIHGEAGYEEKPGRHP